MRVFTSLYQANIHSRRQYIIINISLYFFLSRLVSSHFSFPPALPSPLPPPFTLSSTTPPSSLISCHSLYIRSRQTPPPVASRLTPPQQSEYACLPLASANNVHAVCWQILRTHYCPHCHYCFLESCLTNSSFPASYDRGMSLENTYVYMRVY